MNLFSRVKTVFYSKTEQLEQFLREKHANMQYTFFNPYLNNIVHECD